MEKEEIYAKLEEMAIAAAGKSYSPYSGFRVGAALLAEDGRIFQGCNIENASYGVTICAERTALFKAVSEGAKKFRAIAITGGPEGVGLASPCGICRQALAEFCGPELEILLVTGPGRRERHTLGELLPAAFGAGMMESQGK
jgi:cytidine deaminase